MAIFKIGDKVILAGRRLLYQGEEGIIRGKIDSLGTYEVETKIGTFWRKGWELKLKEEKRANP